MSELLRVKNLSKTFPVYEGIFKTHVADVKAVSSIDFTIEKGKTLGLVGESGSGKSTAGRTAIRLLEPTGGQIFFENQDITKFSEKQLKDFRKDVQMVFQDPFSSLNPRKTIRFSLSEGLLYHKLVATKEEAYEKVVSVLTKVGLSEKQMDYYPHQFSGGGQQRVCIGRAIIMNPKLVLCDEAVSALDVSVQAQVLNLLNELKNELHLSYLFISHDLATVKYLSDRVVVLYLGKVMEEATAESLFSNPKHPYTQALLSSSLDRNQKEKKRVILQGEVPSAINPPSGCPFRTRCPYAKKECENPPPMKHVFDPITGKEDHRYACIL